MQVGIEIFTSAGNPIGDVVGHSLTVGPGATVLSGTRATGIPGVDSDLGVGISKGSARILATSKKLACTAFLAVTLSTPPSSMVSLTIIKKTKQNRVGGISKASIAVETGDRSRIETPGGDG
jgi:hypothetical protein